MSNEKIEVGISLSGGGARGAAHIGALKALTDHDIHPGIISGTSTGAVIGGLYASGHDPQGILAMFKKIELFKLSNYAFGKPGIVDGRKFIPLLKKFIPKNDFNALKYPLVICTTELLEGKVAYFDSGTNLIESILASAALPGVFTPISIGKQMYADGGIMNNMPVDIIRQQCKTLIAMDVNRVFPIKQRQIRNTLDVIERSVQLVVSQNTALQQSHDLLISPQEVPQYGTFDMRSKSLDKLFKIGYEATVALIPEIRKKIISAKEDGRSDHISKAATSVS